MKLVKLSTACVFVLGVVLVLHLVNLPVYAQAGTGIIRVATTGMDAAGCGAVSSPCRTIQYAVNLAAAGDEIHIAQGTYSDINSHNIPSWYEWPATIQQIVYLDKSVTLKGGYDISFAGRDTTAYVTVLDALEKGRGIVVMPGATVVIDGLRITGGNNANLAGAYDEYNYYDVGAGVYIRAATVTINDCHIDNNTSTQDGGGIYVYQGDVTISNSTIENNQAAALIAPGAGIGLGGGVFLDSSSATLTGNVIRNNYADSGGGGINVMDGSPEIRQNQILSNTAKMSGGGLSLARSSAIVTANTIQGNVAQEQDGGGIAMWSDQSTIHNNIIKDNQASDFGAGLAVNKNLVDDVGSIASITYNTITGNSMTKGTGAAIYLSNSQATIEHNTITSNTSPTTWGALLVNLSELTLSHNLFQGNCNTGAGQGIQDTAAIFRSNAILNHNQFLGNTNYSNGSVLKISASNVTGQNNVIAGNKAYGANLAGLRFYAASASLQHTTIAHNSGRVSDGIQLDGEEPNQVLLQNTIVASHTAAVFAFKAQGITLDGVLWYSNTLLTREQAMVTATHAYTGNPAFANPEALDFHITGASAARDRGIDAGVSVDIDGDVRPLGVAPDLGADEYTGPPAISDLQAIQGQVDASTVLVTLAWTPPVEASTISIRYNTGDTITAQTWDAAQTLTDTLPGAAHQYTAVLPNPAGSNSMALLQPFYFALKYQTPAGEMSGISNIAFYPGRLTYLPLVIKGE